MSTVATPPAPPPGNPSVLLHGISWETYEVLLRELTNAHIRLTYDRGSLEIMAPLYRHERSSGVLGRLVDVLTDELDIDYISAWSTTLHSEDLQKGIEPDRSFYIQHVAAIDGKMELDLTTDPPPDLAVEVDITSSSLDRMGIYGALGVPEIWRYDGQQFRVYRRKRDGTYRIVSSSAAFPTLPGAKVLPLLSQVAGINERAMIRALRAWVRANAVPKS